MTHFIGIDSIRVENRTRRTFDEGQLNELRESIERNGLFHAPVVREAKIACGEALPDHWIDGFTLVAGERRLRAIADLYALGGTFKYNGLGVTPGMVPYVTLGELSPLEALEAEIEENAVRADLTWQEKSAADARLMALRSRQAALKGEPPPSVKELATEIFGRQVSTQLHEDTRRNILLAKHLGDEDVKKAKTRDEAWKILKRKEDSKQNAAIAARLGPEVVAHSHTVHHADTREWLAQAPDGEWEVILSDPPYGMGADSFGDSGSAGTAGAHDYEDTYESWQDLVLGVQKDLFRIAAPRAHLYLFCDFDRFHELKGACEAAGWRVHRTPLMWVKPSGFRVPWPEMGPQRKYELILYAVKGDRPVTAVKPDVLEYGLDEALGWPAQKPVALYEELLRRSTRTPGTKVLDMFCGSGPIFPAAHALKCFATGVEKNATAYGIAATRVDQLRKQA